MAREPTVGTSVRPDAPIDLINAEVWFLGMSRKMRVGMFQTLSLARSGKAIASGIGLFAAFASFPALAGPPALLEQAGRYLGAGWGDGYHACKDGGCRPGADLPPGSYTTQFTKRTKPASDCGGIYPPQTGLPRQLRHLAPGCDSTQVFSGRSIIQDSPMSLPLQAPGASAIPHPPMQPIPIEPLEREMRDDGSTLQPATPPAPATTPKPIPTPAPLTPSTEPSLLDENDPRLDLPPAWEEGQASDSLLPGSDLQSPENSGVQPSEELSSPSDRSMDLLPDVEELPSPSLEDASLLDERLLNESEEQSIQEDPDALLPQPSLDPLMEQLPAPKGMKLDSASMPRGYQPLVRSNPYVGSRTPGTSRPVSAPSVRRLPVNSYKVNLNAQRQWKPVRQP